MFQSAVEFDAVYIKIVEHCKKTTDFGINGIVD